ncbi:alpha-amlyase [Bacillus sp. FJAT-18017]|uniref:alpha-amylase family glycosyl hydrolase n=1 Tax=Bacillus sp. FJAT-18017 TaxID=1705566 RepID=UPI0006AF27AB|nr:alpha-amylase family glycosyl hydrolase [Bacillus sp. FJAT-18017]ALC91893.1 alpha-amlyase [Bacillus sp. FJAT-18017]
MGKKAAILLLAICFALGALPVQAAEKAERQWQDETIYFLMVDRFSNGDANNDFNANPDDPKAYHGGDFKGIIDKLDYIKNMGFTAIWLTPVFDNEDGGYHGYWINDFYKTDEHFGTISEFKKLVEEAHKRDIKIILDFVVNHVGPSHPWQNDPDKAGWFHVKKPIVNWESQEELENNWLYDLPDFNQDNPAVKNYLLDAAKWWITETGIDGYRLDTVRHVPVSFWEEFSKEVKAQKEDFYLIGEVWTDDPNYIAQYDKAGIDGFVDFPLHEQLREAFAKPDQTLDWLFSTAARNKVLYEDPFLMGTFIDNHDMVRFTREALLAKEDPVSRWKLALTYMYTAPGIPIIYYGSEIALDGTNDPDNRREMDFTVENGLIDYISRLGELRKERVSLTRGTLEKLHEKDGMAIFKRQYNAETTIIAINNTSSDQTVKIPIEKLGENKSLQGLLDNQSISSDSDGYSIPVGSGGAEMYSLEEESFNRTPYLIGFAAILGVGMALLFIKSRKKQQNV